jgi:hypothetical protein
VVVAPLGLMVLRVHHGARSLRYGMHVSMPLGFPWTRPDCRPHSSCGFGAWILPCSIVTVCVLAVHSSLPR